MSLTKLAYNGDSKIIKNLVNRVNALIDGGGGASTLAELTDTNITNPSNDQVLTYDSATSKWKNKNAPASGVTDVQVDGTSVVTQGVANLPSIPEDIDDLGNVIISSPSDKQVLEYDATTQKWKNATPSGGGSSWTDIEGTLLAGQTSITLNSSSIKLTSTFEFFTDVFGVCPTNAVISVGSITLTFDAQANDLGVKVRVTNTGAVSPYTFKSYLGVGSTAGAYINTGLNIATTQEFEVKFQLTNTQADNVVYFGCWQSYKDTMIYYYGGGFGGGVGGTMTPRHNFDTDIHVYKAMQDAIYLDDVQDGGVNWANVPTNVPYYFFKDPDHSGAINIRIYYAKIWDNGTLIRDFIPAVRNDDGVIGMYDQVNDVFYTNDGTGSFVTD